jgi:hypothetical protein
MRLASYEIPGWLGHVLAAGRGGPPERPVGKLVHVPLGVLLDPVVVSAGGTGQMLGLNLLNFHCCVPAIIADGVTVTSCPPRPPDRRILCVARFVQVK